MTTDQVGDYLEKQLFIENTVVTYRLLSRELGIHVNDARLELQKYRSLRKDVHATYVMIGSPPPRYGLDGDSSMKIDEEEVRRWEENTGGEAVQERLMLLVSEDELEDSKSQFYIIDSIDVYSLSAVYLIDADLVCKEKDRVRELDAQDKTGELAKKVGRIVGRNVKKRKPVKRSLKGKGKLGAASTTSKSTIKKGPTGKKDTVVKKDTTIKAEPTKSNKELTKEKSSAPIEKKSTKAGTLDWSKAKSKAEKEKEKADELKARAEKEAKEAKAKREKEKEGKEKEKPKPKQTEDKPAESVKRGVKRKTGALEVSDSEQSAKPPSPEPPRGAKLKGRVIFSDDDESDEPKPRKGKGKASAQSSDVEELERSVRVMMDIDDEEVENVTKVAAPMKPIPKSKSKSRVVESPDEEEHSELGDGEDSMYVDDEPPEVKRKKPRKKAEKKAVVVGKNGLRKKRVMKSRVSLDEKGYRVTEDYSSYESVDEEEPEEPEKPKKLISKPSVSKPKRNASVKGTKAPSKEVKKRASMGSGLTSKPSAAQSDIASFFSKKP